MTPRTVLLTGASDGIGAAAAAQLSAHGHRVLVTGRSPEKTAAVARASGATPFVADFSRLDDVRRLAQEVGRELDGAPLDVLANNAGGILGTAQPSADGFEQTFQVNHLAPFLLTHLLLPSLQAGAGIVVATSSIANRLFGRLDLEHVATPGATGANRSYGDAKLANILFTRGLDARYGAQGIHAVAFHPGTVATSFASDTSSLMRLVYRTPLRHLVLVGPEVGGATLTWFCEGTPGTTWQPGAYYDQRRPSGRVNPQARDDALVDGLWRLSEQLVGLD